MHKIGKFLMQMLHVFRHRIRDWLHCNGSGADETKTEETIWGGWGHRRTNKQYLVGLWSNSDYELSQETNTQNGTCHCGLKNLGCEKLALKLDGF
jgi:hypothetical protein